MGRSILNQTIHQKGRAGQIFTGEGIWDGGVRINAIKPGEMSEGSGELTLHVVKGSLRSIDDAKKALNGYPLDFPIEIILKGTDEESKALYDQVLSAVQNLGYKNISKTVIGMYLSVGEVIENDFNYKIDNGKLVFSIYLQKE